MAQGPRIKAVKLLNSLRSRYEEEQILDFLINDYFGGNVAYEALLAAKQELEANISCDLEDPLCNDDQDQEDFFDFDEEDEFDELEHLVIPHRDTDSKENQNPVDEVWTFWPDYNF
jgi:hypothetical protein